MSRRNKKRIVGSRSLLYVAVIVSLSTIGIGYGAWTNRISVKIGVTTGNIDRSIKVGSLGEGRLSYNLLDDDMTLNIYGTVYPNFQDEISFEIQDNGSIPSILKSLDELNTTEIIQLSEQNKNSNSRYYLMDETKTDKFQLNIKTQEIDNIEMIREIDSFSIQKENYRDESNLDKIKSEIEFIQNEINDIQSEIYSLRDLKESHSFKYNLNFEQGL